MNLNSPAPPGIKETEPDQLEPARLLAGRISKLNCSQLAELMSLSDKLAAETKKNAVSWGKDNRPRLPALFCFTGLFYKFLDAYTLDTTHLKDAQKRIRILSGLYGLLRPLDLIEAYRLEMGQKLTVGHTKTIAGFWKEAVTLLLNKQLKAGEPVVSVAAKEYIKAIDIKKLKGAVIEPVFKEQQADGSYRTVAVHAKKARGALVRYALVNQAQEPSDLTGFSEMGWKAAEKAPESGPWLFTRPARKKG